MSYCRWSSDDWTCDLYCYGDVNGGYTTHVAANRSINIPKVTIDIRKDLDGWYEQYQTQMKALDTAEREYSKLPHAGATFNDSTPQAFKERLLMLRELGYNFPDDVLEEIDEEIKETQNGNQVGQDS